MSELPSPPPLALRVNGASEAHAVTTLVDLLDAKGVEASRKGIAIAVNGAVVPRAQWAARMLASGDAVEIIHAKQGG